MLSNRSPAAVSIHIFRIHTPLSIALFVSLAIHLGFLFRWDVHPSAAPMKNPLRAELRPTMKSLDGAERSVENGHAEEARAAPDLPGKRNPEPEKPKPEKPRPPAKPEKAAMKKTEAAKRRPKPLMSVPSSESSEDASGDAIPYTQEFIELPDAEAGGSHNAGGILGASSAPSRLPPRGRIHYRVDLGDREFEAGKAMSEWTIAGENYYLRMESETVGLAWLVKPYHVVMESRGRILPEGLAPEKFSILRNGEDNGEAASFDWGAMTVSIGKSRTPQAMENGTQDLLSFNFQLGFMRHPIIGSRLPITTGKKYGVYHLERLGDEEIETPLGKMRVLHLRAAGANMTELWLAYDYLLLPVRLRFVDSKGQSFVQTALKIQVDDGRSGRDAASPNEENERVEE